MRMDCRGKHTVWVSCHLLWNSDVALKQTDSRQRTRSRGTHSVRGGAAYHTTDLQKTSSWRLHVMWKKYAVQHRPEPCSTSFTGKHISMQTKGKDSSVSSRPFTTTSVLLQRDHEPCHHRVDLNPPPVTQPLKQRVDRSSGYTYGGRL